MYKHLKHKYLKLEQATNNEMNEWMNKWMNEWMNEWMNANK